MPRQWFRYVAGEEKDRWETSLNNKVLVCIREKPMSYIEKGGKEKLTYSI